MKIVIEETNNKVKIIYSKFTDGTKFSCNSSASIIRYTVELKLKTGTYADTEEFLNSFTEELNAVKINGSIDAKFTYAVENDYVTLQCNSNYGFGFCYTASGISNNIFFQNFPFLTESDFGSTNKKNKAQNKITFVVKEQYKNYSLVSTCSTGNCQGYAGKLIIKHVSGAIGAIGEFPLGSMLITDYVEKINNDAMNIFGIKYNICEFFEAIDNEFEIAIMFKDIVKIYIPEALLNQLGFQKNKVSNVDFSTISELKNKYGSYTKYEAYYDCSSFIFNNVLICNMLTMFIGHIIIDNVRYILNNSILPKNPYCILTKIAKLITGYTGINTVGEITQGSILESTLIFTQEISDRVRYSNNSLTTDYYSISTINNSSQKGLKITINNYYNKPCVDPDNIFAPTIVNQISTIPCSNCMTGTMSRTCNSDYTFSEIDKSNCIVQYCQEENLNGEIWSKTAAGETASISCPTNYKGVVYRRCDCSSVEWGVPDDSNCVRAECPADNKFPKTYAGETVTLDCASNQTGKIKRFCKSDGTWAPVDNTCEDNYCPVDIGFPKTLGGTTATLDCAVNQSGSITRFCNNDGTWAPVDNTCEDNYCPVDNDFPKTLGGTTATLDCAINQSGTIKRFCNNDGTWEPEVNTCKDNYCPAIDNFPKTIASSSAYLECPQGYEGSGISKYCNVNGVWEETIEKCTQIVCTTDQGFGETKAGETAVKPCESGYIGNYRRLCNATGSWGPIINSCSQAVYCLENEYKGFTWPRTEVGKTVELTCPSDPNIKVSRTCRVTQEWGETTPETIPSTCVIGNNNDSSESNNLMLYIIIGIIIFIVIIIVIIIIRKRK